MDTKKIYQVRFAESKEKRYSLWNVLIKDFFQKYVDKNDVVLDLGCGYGEFINQIKCGKKIAVDLNSDSKKFLSKDIVFIKQSATNLSKINSSSVNKIFVSNLYEHLERPDIILSVKESRRILKKRGQVLVLQPNIRFLAADFWRFFDHVTPIDDRALEELFESEGFELKKIILKFLPFTTKSTFAKWTILTKIYLFFPMLWNIFGKQSFLVFEKS